MSENNLKIVRCDEAGLEETAAVLLAGGVAVIPTDTVYGLAAHPAFPAAVERLYTIKGREAKKPIALLASDAEAVERFGFPLTGRARELVRFWPGALTLVIAPQPAPTPTPKPPNPNTPQPQHPNTSLGGLPRPRPRLDAAAAREVRGAPARDEREPLGAARGDGRAAGAGGRGAFGGHRRGRRSEPGRRPVDRRPRRPVRRSDGPPTGRRRCRPCGRIGKTYGDYRNFQ